MLIFQEQFEDPLCKIRHLDLNNPGYSSTGDIGASHFIFYLNRKKDSPNHHFSHPVYTRKGFLSIILAYYKLDSKGSLKKLNYM